jgi:TniQ
LPGSKKLLRRPRPYPTESLASYIIRLAENNYYPQVNWIFQMSGLKRRGVYANVFSPKTDDLSQLCLLSETEEDVLWSMAFPSVNQSHFRTLNTVEVFGNVIPLSALKKNSVKLCPICLDDSPYYHQVWNLSIVTACSIHQCLLIDRCPQCQQEILWSRASIVKCKCQLDWRLVQPKFVEVEQVNLSSHVYNLCQLAGRVSSQSLSIAHPVSHLSLNHLVTLLESLARFCQHPLVKQIFFSDSFQLSSNSDVYFDSLFALLKNWPQDLFSRIEEYEVYLNHFYGSCYITSKTDLDMFAFFQAILSCFAPDSCRLMREVLEDYFWKFLRKMSLKRLQVSFYKHSKFYSIGAPLTKANALFRRLTDKLDLSGLTLAKLLSESRIDIYEQTIFFKMPYSPSPCFI